MKLVLGLGNPGETYAMHRHNIGFIMIDRLAKDLNVPIEVKKKKTVFGRGKIDKTEFLLLKPLTFMNLSGEAALYMASFMKIAVEDIVVIYDDTEIALGKFKVKVGGGDGGHNGIKSLIDYLKSENFTRIRIGIGRPRKGQELSDYVLSPFTKDEREILRGISDDIVGAAKLAMFESPERAMNEYNGGAPTARKKAAVESASKAQEKKSDNPGKRNSTDEE